MKTLRLSRAEITRHRGFLPILAVLFLVIVPCLYGALYLWSNWDPYGSLEEVPVAVVNEDQPVKVDGKDVHAGADLVENMQADPIFGWTMTDADDAAEGLEDGRFYMTITIPKDFSASLASGADGTPRKADVKMARNDANGYVVGIMAESVQSKLHQQINSAAVEAYFDSVYGDLDRLRDGLVKADNGAHKLSKGLDKAVPGSQDLADGLTDAASGANKLSDGASQVAGGTQELADIINPLADDVVPLMPDVADGAASVSSTVSDVTGLVSGGGDSLAKRTEGVDDALAELAKKYPDLASDPLFKDVKTKTEGVADRTNEVADKLDKVNNDAEQVETDAHKLVSAVPNLQQKVRGGQANINKLNDGAHQVADGASELAEKLPAARDGAKDLAKGIKSASKGASQLSDGLDTMVKSVPAMDPDTREANAAILGDPTSISLHVDNPAENYGRGLAPFFFAISLWVFGIVVFLVLRPTTGRAMASKASPVRMVLAGWLPVVTVGLVGSWLLLGVSQFLLGLDVVRPWQAFGMVSLATIVFTLVAHLLRNWLGLVGSAILLVLLMLQLTSSGGIYPVETLPAPLLAIHPYLPMSYLVDGLRVVFTGGSSSHLLLDTIVLACVGVAAFAANCLVMAKKRTYSMASLHPALGE